MIINKTQSGLDTHGKTNTDTEYYIFNPDTEMALAAGGVSYTPPAAVKRYIDTFSLFPALYAPDGASIIVDKSLINHIDTLPYYDEACSRNMTVCTYESITPGNVRPWGWNMALRQKLINADIPAEIIPSEEQINRIRSLAHRSLTTRIHEYFQASLKPQFFTHIDEALCYANTLKEHGFVAKLPWSSSGRGVFFNPDKLTLSRMMHRQGGVMIEPLWDKGLDFATEWVCRDGRVEFCGFSLFQNNNLGKWGDNMVASQDVIREHIEKYCDGRQLTETINRLSTALTRYVAPDYEGPLGVDMLCNRKGNINPCVEVNMRMTMGHVALRMFAQNRIPPAGIIHTNIMRE